MAVDDTSSRWPGMDPGKFRNPITILSLQPSSPPTYDAGGLVSTYQPLWSAMAYLEILRGTDLIRAGQDVTKTWIELTIRYQPGIQPQMQVQIPDYASVDPTNTGAVPGFHTYIIQAVENVEHRNVLLKLMCLGIDANT